MSDLKISQLSDYTTPQDVDLIPVVDTGNATTKRTTWANIKATLKSYFDTIYTLVNLGGVATTRKITINGTQQDLSTDRSWTIATDQNASDTVIGSSKLSVAPVDPATPIAVGDNDGRLPTTDQKAALAGTGTPNSTNKYVTSDDANYTGTEKVSNKSTNATTDKASDTKYPSVKAITTYVDTNHGPVYIGSQTLANGANTITAGYQSSWNYVVIAVVGSIVGQPVPVGDIIIFKSGKLSGMVGTFINGPGYGTISATYNGITTITMATAGTASFSSATAYYYQ